MKRLLLLLLICVMGISSYSQDSLQLQKNKKSKIFEASVYGSEKHVSRGILVQQTDSSLVLGKGKDSLCHIHYSEIQTIKLQNKNRVVKGAGIGFLFGAAVGVGFAYSLNASMGGGHMPYGGLATSIVVGGIGGTFIGALIGSITSRTFIINGSKEKLMKMKGVW